MDETNKNIEQPEENKEITREKLKSNLCERGFREEDVEVAMNLMSDIFELNLLVFGDKIPILYGDSVKILGKEAIASYVEASPTSKEMYCVYIPDLVHRMESLKKSEGLWFDVDGKLRTGEPESNGQEVAFDEFVVGIAAHEVRHRVQQRPDFKKIDVSKDEETEADARIVEYKAMSTKHNGKSLDDIAKIIEKID